MTQDIADALTVAGIILLAIGAVVLISVAGTALWLKVRELRGR